MKKEGAIITDADFNKLASWASIISLAITVLSLYLIGSIRNNIIESRRKGRLRDLFSDVARIQDDALPMSNATKSKFQSLDRNLPSAWPLYWSKKSMALRGIRNAILAGEIASVKEGIEDYKSHCEDL